jgi:ferrous iron transport protein A
MLLPLELVDAGEWAEVAELNGEASWVGRLAELGIRVGIRLQVVQPGRPCLLQIDGSRLSLRGEAATQIWVSPVPVAG